MAGRRVVAGKRQLLTKDEVLHVARLARLELSEGEISLFQKQLSEILAYVGQLQAVDTSGVAETSQVTGLENVSRQDATSESQRLSQKEALMNAPQTQDGYFKVKAVLRVK